jgi:tRNA(Ile)-lysidine synthase
VREVLERYGALKGLGVACSGGPDSAVLADAAMALHRRGAIGPISLIHVDHGLREGSGDDAGAVKALADAGGGRFIGLRVEVDRQRASLEDAAREARYAALDRAAADHDLKWILVAHTASDQAETVLMRVIRGTGITGLSGIPERRDIYLRPLLSVARSEVDQYASAAGLGVVTDPMNADPAHLRVRVRRHWLPELRGENPSLDAALCRLATSAGEIRAAIDSAARPLLDRAGSIEVDRLSAIPDAIVKRTLAMASDDAGLGPLGAVHLESLLELVRRSDAGTVTIDLPGGTARREYNHLRFVAHMPDTSETSGNRSVVRATGPGGPYAVRAWEAGDRMCPARLKGRSRKLSDLFGDAKVPRDERPGAQVVVRESDGVIVWAEHVGNAHDVDVCVSLTTSSTVASNKVSD